MVWPFKKSEDDIPELPELPELPPLPDTLKLKEEEKLPPLPTFPSSQTGERISNMALKQAINQSEPDLETRNMESQEMQKPLTREIPRQDFQERMSREIKPSIKIEPVFVRIDKYQESLSSFQEIKRKMLEIENILRDIKNIKAREEQELLGWEQELQQAKIKLDKIDKSLFQKLE